MNAFLDLADKQMVAATKAKHRAREKREAKVTMVPTETEKKERERSQLLTRHRAWRREQEEELFKGPHGADLVALKAFLRKMTLNSADELVAFIERQTWLQAADRHIRAGALTMIGNAVMRLRERNGLSPFDDALPGEPANAFLQIRELLK